MRPQSPRMRTTHAARLLLIPYAIALGLIVWLPASEASKATGIVFAIARWVSGLTDLDPTTTSTVFEFLANIVLFVPLGLLVTAAWPGVRPWRVVLLGLAVSTTIELVQTMLPSRFPTVSDVIANTVGAGLGWMVARALATGRPASGRVGTWSENCGAAESSWASPQAD